MSAAPDRYAVVGNPVSHSKSPLIHRLFAAQSGRNIAYEALPASATGFEKLVEEFFRGGGAGLNVTVPFKQRAWAMCQRLSANAARSRAVNTLYRQDGELCGANTDGIGLVRDIRDNHGIGIEGRRVLLLGAGGAIRGVLPALEEQAPACLSICNRSAERAARLCKDFAGSVSAASVQELRGRQFDLIVNGTSSGLQGELPAVDERWLAKGCCCYDMVYGEAATPFQRWARESGAATALDGLGMLVEQAAESFRIWLGVTAETAAVIRRLRERG